MHRMHGLPHPADAAVRHRGFGAFRRDSVQRELLAGRDLVADLSRRRLVRHPERCRSVSGRAEAKERRERGTELGQPRFGRLLRRACSRLALQAGQVRRDTVGRPFHRQPPVRRFQQGTPRRFLCDVGLGFDLRVRADRRPLALELRIDRTTHQGEADLRQSTQGRCRRHDLIVGSRFGIRRRGIEQSGLQVRRLGEQQLVGRRTRDQLEARLGLPRAPDRHQAPVRSTLHLQTCLDGDPMGARRRPSIRRVACPLLRNRNRQRGLAAALQVEVLAALDAARDGSRGADDFHRPPGVEVEEFAVEQAASAARLDLDGEGNLCPVEDPVAVRRGQRGRRDGKFGDADFGPTGIRAGGERRDSHVVGGLTPLGTARGCEHHAAEQSRAEQRRASVHVPLLAGRAARAQKPAPAPLAPPPQR